MKLTFGDEVEVFRQEFLAWLAENRPTESEMAADPSLSSGHNPEWMRQWTRRMFDDGWLVPGWPPERGGRNAGPIETLVYLEELNRAGVPRTTNPQGLGIIAPSLFDYGSEHQIRDYAMPVLQGERSACLGMSEPGAGSDLASLSTRAVVDGDNLIINGQKVWTSGANYADFCFLFCRTDPDAPKHKGISVVLVDMTIPGVTVRPLAEIVRPEWPDLNEVFFDEVVVPRSNLVGQMNNGWAMANGSLAHERGMVWLHQVMGLEADLEKVRAAAPAALARLSPVERDIRADALVQSFVDSAAARCLGYRGFARTAKGEPSPEHMVLKLFGSEVEQALYLAASEAQRAAALDITADRGVSGAYGTGAWPMQYLRSFGNTIAGGTSEIQRNVIAERVLGLPRS
jgi:alkylation response protein AidB-like acyl-CoA dehydrogenase